MNYYSPRNLKLIVTIYLDAGLLNERIHCADPFQIEI